MGNERGDIVTLTFNGITQSKTVTTMGNVGAGWSFSDLQSGIDYPVLLKTERGNKYSITNVTARMPESEMHR